MRAANGERERPSVAVGFATINRPHVVQRLVRSIRQRFPAIPIYAAEQSLRIAPLMLEFYARQNVNLLRLPYDCGVTVARNAIVKAMPEEFLLLCDDDFIFTDDTGFALAVDFLKAHADFGVVGGHLRDHIDGNAHSRHWELFLLLDSANRQLVSIPIDCLAPRFTEFRGLRFYGCDAVMNFAILRKKMFDDGVWWDERFKSNGEHEDFFLTIKHKSAYKVAYFPGLTADHNHPKNSGYAQLRSRTFGWRLMFQKWGVTQHLDLGYGLRTDRQIGVVHPPNSVREAFFRASNGRVDLSGGWGDDKVNIEGVGRIYGNGLTDRSRFGGSGAPPAKDWVNVDLPTSGGGLVYRRPAAKSRTPAGHPSDGGAGAIEDFDIGRDHIDIRYHEKIMPSEDFIVHLAAHSWPEDGANEARAPAVRCRFFMRWYSGSRFVEWESAVSEAVFARGIYTAIALPYPSWRPKDRYLGFDFCVEDRAQCYRLASGVVMFLQRLPVAEIDIAGDEVGTFSFVPVAVRQRILRACKLPTAVFTQDWRTLNSAWTDRDGTTIFKVRVNPCVGKAERFFVARDLGGGVVSRSVDFGCLPDHATMAKFIASTIEIVSWTRAPPARVRR